MAQLVRNKKTGEYALYDPTTGTIPISPEQAEQFQKSRGERFLGSYADTLQDSAGEFMQQGAGGGSNILSQSFGRALNPLGGLLDMAGVNPVTDVGERIQTANDQRQAVRAEVDPFMSGLGTAAGVATELLAPTPRTSVAGRVASSVPASPGTAKGVEMANTISRTAEALRPVRDAVSPRRILRESGLVDADAIRSGRFRSLSADVTEGATRVPRAADTFELGYDVEGAVGRGMPLTRGDAEVLTAPAGPRGREQLDAGDLIREQEELSRARATPQAQTVNRIRSEQEQWITDRVAEELGNEQLSRLTIPNVNTERTRIGNTFDRVLRRGDDDFVVELGEESATTIREALGDVPEVAKTGTFNRLQEDILNLVERNTVSGGELNTVRNAINALRDRLYKSGTTYDAGVALDRVENVLNDSLRQTMSPADIADFDQALGQWKMVKALEGAMRAADAGGSVNIGTFRNVYLRQNALARKGYNLSDFENDLLVADYVLNKANIPNSGTPLRMGPRGLGIGAGGVAAGLGLGGLLGE